MEPKKKAESFSLYIIKRQQNGLYEWVRYFVTWKQKRACIGVIWIANKCT